MSDTARQQAEDGALALLVPLHHTRPDGYVKALKPFNGEFTGIGREDSDFQRITQGKIPAILVTTGDGAIEDQTMGRVGSEIFTLQVIVASCNLRSPEARHRGDSAHSRDPGVYKMLKDIRDRLWLRPMDDADQVCFARPVGDSAVLRARDRTIWLSTYTIRADAKFPPLSDEARDLLGIDLDFNFPTGDPEEEDASPVIEADNDLATS